MGLKQTPKLHATKDYTIFEMHDHNRPLADRPHLEQSMRSHGFMPSSPIQCVRGTNGKLKIVRGHHRFYYAKKLGLAIWYIIDESNTDLFDLEGDSGPRWSLADFVYARANAGNKDCAAVLEFQKKHGLPLGAVISLLGGESAGSGNKMKSIKTGMFKIGNTKYASMVVEITDRCRELNIQFGTSTSFVSAVSLALRVPEFNRNRFLHVLSLNPMKLGKRSTVDDYLDEIEALYNYGAKDRRIPLKHMAKEIGRQRQETFGGKQHAAQNPAENSTHGLHSNSEPPRHDG